MSSTAAVTGRTTTLLTGNAMLAQLRRTQTEMFDAQRQISTGKAVERPSDAPDKAAAIALLQSQLAARAQHDSNLDHAATVLDHTDASLADINDILLEARSIASSQIGVGSDAATREAEAQVIDAQVQALMQVVNRQTRGVSLFGGGVSLGTDEPVFVEFMGGVRYLGGEANLRADVGRRDPMAIDASGPAALGSLSTRVRGEQDLNPQATAATRLVDVNGAQGRGVRLGPVRLTVDGSEQLVDLAGARSLGDVTTRINAVIDQLSPGAGQLTVSGDGLSLTAEAGRAIRLEDLGEGETAGDLGLRIEAIGGATPTTTPGGDIDARLTMLTPLSALPGGIDWASGLSIRQGEVTRTADFSGATTVQDVIRAVDRLNLGVRMTINEAGAGFDLVSEVSGLTMSIGEAAGGSTAADLGLRTLDGSTRLSDLRLGEGVASVEGEPDFSIELSDGGSIAVDVHGATTVDEVLAQVADAWVDAGFAPAALGSPGEAGTRLNVGLRPDGRGLRLEDNSGGGGVFAVRPLGESLAASHLGLELGASTGPVIDGSDVGGVRVESLFTHLADLSASLRNDDSVGITVAGGKLESDIDRAVEARAEVGVRAADVAAQQSRSSTQEIAERTLLSDMQDADMAEAITRFSQLMQQLEASLSSNAQSLQLSLLDFLR